MRRNANEGIYLAASMHSPAVWLQSWVDPGSEARKEGRQASGSLSIAWPRSDANHQLGEIISVEWTTAAPTGSHLVGSPAQT